MVGLWGEVRLRDARVNELLLLLYKFHLKMFLFKLRMYVCLLESTKRH